MSNVALWFLIPLTFASFLGILINSYILLVVLFSRQYTSVNNLLLLHLGALNLCLGATFFVFSAPGLVHDSWLSNGIFCHFHGILFTVLHPLILWTICGLNADRYYAIAAPLHYGHLVNPKKVFLCLGIGWIISLSFIMFPFFQIAPFAFNRGLGACVPHFQSGRSTIWYSAAYTAFTLLLPITLIICCNVKILMIARYHRHRIASAIYEVTLSAQVTITHQRNPFFVPTVTAPSSGGPKFRSRSPISTLLQLLGSFVVLYVPYYSIILWESCLTFLELEASNANNHVILYQIVLVLLTLSPTINGFLYGLKNKNLRKTFQHYWRKKLTKSEVNQEIQARTPSTCGSRRQSLTPLGFFARPNIQRRLSEALLDTHTDDSNDTKNKIKRIASELTWRPTSQSEISMTGGCTLQVPKANISESNLDLDLANLHLEGFHQTGRTDDNVKFSIEDPIEDTKEMEISKENLVLPLEANFNPTNKNEIEAKEEKEECKKKTNFFYKFFGIDENRTPKILITRALSEDDYSKNIRESSKHSLSVSNSLSKWYHHSDYNLISDQTSEDDPNSKTHLLGEGPFHFEAPVNDLDQSDDSDADNSEHVVVTENSENSDNLSGLYMNLDSCDTLRTQSYDIDMQDIEQIESIETELGNSSYEEDDLKSNLEDCKFAKNENALNDVESIKIGNGSLHLNAIELNCMDNTVTEIPMKTIDDLKDINQHEVVL